MRTPGKKNGTTCTETAKARGGTQFPCGKLQINAGAVPQPHHIALPCYTTYVCIRIKVVSWQLGFRGGNLTLQSENALHFGRTSGRLYPASHWRKLYPGWSHVALIIVSRCIYMVFNIGFCRSHWRPKLGDKLGIHCRSIHCQPCDRSIASPVQLHAVSCASYV